MRAYINKTYGGDVWLGVLICLGCIPEGTQEAVNTVMDNRRKKKKGNGMWNAEGSRPSARNQAKANGKAVSEIPQGLQHKRSLEYSLREEAKTARRGFDEWE